MIYTENLKEDAEAFRKIKQENLGTIPLIEENKNIGKC